MEGADKEIAGIITEVDMSYEAAWASRRCSYAV